MTLKQQLARNIKLLRQQGWTDYQIQAYVRGWNSLDKVKQ